MSTDSHPTLIEAWLESGTSFSVPIKLSHVDTALVVVDVQYLYASREHGFGLAFEALHPGSCEVFGERVETLVIPAIQQLLDVFRERGMLVVYLVLGSDDRDLADMPKRQRAAVRALEQESGVADLMWLGSQWARVRDEIAPEPADLIVKKSTFGAFASSDLEHALRSRGIENLVFSGVTTNACVETTARVAADLGFGCVLVDQALAEYDLGAHQSSLQTFHQKFGRVVGTVEDVIADLDESVQPALTQRGADFV